MKQAAFCNLPGTKSKLFKTGRETGLFFCFPLYLYTFYK